MMVSMKIGEAAAQVGVAAHVLRHWEDVGVVVPGRSTSGHRDYSADELRRLRIVRACQDVGLSLREIRAVLHRGESEREQVIDRRLDLIRAQKAELDRAEAFFIHVKECRHSLIARCAECSRYARRPGDGGVAQAFDAEEDSVVRTKG